MTVTVHSEPVGTDDVAAVCSDVALAYDLQANVTAGNGMTSNFVWVAGTNVNVLGESTTPQVGPIINDAITNITGSDQTVIYTVTPTETTDNCVGDTFTVTVTVHSEPVGVNDVDAACSDVALAYDLQANVNSISGNNMASTFSWIAADNLTVSGESTVVQAGSTITDVITNISGVDQVVLYTVTPTSNDANTCAGDDFTISVTISSEPLGLNDTRVICSNTNVLYDLQNNVNLLGNAIASSFTWIATDNANVTGESTVLQAGSSITDILRNFTNVNQDVIYTVIPTGSNTCLGDAFQITVTVEPEPLGVDDVTKTCSDVALTYNLQNNISGMGNVVASSFVWVAASNPSVNGESITNQAGGTINDVLTNITGGRSNRNIYCYTY